MGSCAKCGDSCNPSDLEMCSAPSCCHGRVCTGCRATFGTSKVFSVFCTSCCIKCGMCQQAVMTPPNKTQLTLLMKHWKTDDCRKGSEECARRLGSTSTIIRVPTPATSCAPVPAPAAIRPLISAKDALKLAE